MRVTRTNKGRRKEIGLEKRLRTRLRLLEAAARVVAHLGEDESTIDHFINAAGVARGTFYNYFPTREDLIKSLWEHVGQDPFRAIQKISAGVTDPAERIILEARLVINNAAEDPAWGWLVWYLSRSAETLNEDLRAYPMPDLVAGRDAKRLMFQNDNAARDLVVSVVRSAIRATLTEKPPASYVESLCIMMLLALGLTARESRKIAQLPLPDLEIAPGNGAAAPQSGRKSKILIKAGNSSSTRK